MADAPGTSPAIRALSSGPDQQGAPAGSLVTYTATVTNTNAGTATGTVAGGTVTFASGMTLAAGALFGLAGRSCP